MRFRIIPGIVGGMEKNADRPLKVNEITSIIKEMLEGALPSVAVEGEVSNFKPSSTGHYYFTLKDEKAAIRAVMFKYSARGLSFSPEDGMQVIARGRISVYEKSGSYQIICSSLEQAGMGTILAMLEERKKKLAAEGLFDEKRKKPVPTYPERVALVTSPTGAALQDILRVLKRRNAGMNIRVLPAPVQGGAAAGEISRQIRYANTHKLSDVIICGRGGGSIEDLLPFSEESVIRAIADSDIPVISAVGHEIDFALSDFAADKRAPTPSAAAEIVSISRSELYERVISARQVITDSMRGTFEQTRSLLKQFQPRQLAQTFRLLMQPLMQRTDDAKESLYENANKYITAVRHRLEISRNTIEASNHEHLLKRGYSVIRSEQTGKIIHSTNGLVPDKCITIQVQDGTGEAVVTRKKGGKNADI